MGCEVNPVRNYPYPSGPMVEMRTFNHLTYCFCTTSSKPITSVLSTGVQFPNVFSDARVYRNGCRCNERLIINTETGGSNHRGTVQASRDFNHNWTNSILQQMKRKFWNIADALFRISWMTNSFKYRARRSVLPYTLPDPHIFQFFLIVKPFPSLGWTPGIWSFLFFFSLHVY